MTQVFLALGSNVGQRLERLQQAVVQLQKVVTIAACSSVYESAAAYVEDQPPFLNAVVSGTTSLSPFNLLHSLQAIEQQLGRHKGRRFGPRTVDLDILVYADVQLATPELCLPHPRMHERAFVVQPLKEIAPGLQPPGWTHTIEALAATASLGQILAVIAPPTMLWPIDGIEYA